LITLYDSNGDEIVHFEPFHAGSPVLRSTGAETGPSISFSPPVERGRYADGWDDGGAVPEDGHPALAYDVTT